MAISIGRCLLYELIARAGKTPTQFADETGISLSTLSLYANNKRIMSLETAKIIAESLGVSIDDLYEWHGSVKFRGLLSR
jgi:transcriptional regulator with XRE-family HTH domain